MTDEKNLEKSSQDYKKSQYGSWYKKSEERKLKLRRNKLRRNKLKRKRNP